MTGAKLLVEDIVPRKSVIVTTVTEKPVGEVVRDGETFILIEVKTVIRRRMSTFQVVDPDTGRTVTLEQREDSEVQTQRREMPRGYRVRPPSTSERVEQDRVGQGTWSPAATTESQQMAHLTLDSALLRALANSVEIRLVSFDPAISREEIVRAAAEFDFLLAGSFEYEKRDERTDSNFGGGRSETHTWQLELSQKTITGADWSLGWTMTRTWDDQIFRNLPTRYEPRLLFQLAQPLLRDAWPAFNLARVRVAAINDKITREAFRQRVEEVITEVISTYWRLVQARRDLEIQRLLLAITERTRDRIRERMRIEATQVELQQSEAAVKVRTAVLLQAERAVLDVQQRLARLLADPQINALSDYEIFPDTQPYVEQVKPDATDKLVTALKHNPIMAQARAAIEIADVNVLIAENQTLPRLELSLSTEIQGLGGEHHEAYEKFWTHHYMNYGIGGMFEYPIGNRSRIAQLRQKKYERLKAIATMQNTADQVATVIRERIREVQMSFREMQAQKEAVLAAEANLEALEEREKLREALSPSFLQTKLSAQEVLAEAARGEAQAIASYNVALAELDRATGTVLESRGVKLAMPVALGEQAWPPEQQAQLPR